jgi:F420-dependent oxidoreductase-like protein
VNLGYSVGVWHADQADEAATAVRLADQLGYDSAWTAEAYGADALTPLAWWGATTSLIKLGTAVAQLSARTATATAMAAITLDHLSGGRFTLGLGASGPQVVEGWYGQPYARPLERTREYIEVVRQVIERRAPVRFSGEQISLPYRGDNATGLGKPLKSIVKPLRPELPVLLAAEGPRNVALAAEIADGWLPMWFSPRSDGFYRAALAAGDARRTYPRNAPFEIACPVSVAFAATADEAADLLRPKLALYVGGMGAKGANFHLDVFGRLGWGEVCDQVQDLFLAGDRAGAAKAIPLAMVEDVALVGPPAKVREDLQRWERTCLTTLIVSGHPSTLEPMARIFGL